MALLNKKDRLDCGLFCEKSCIILLSLVISKEKENKEKSILAFFEFHRHFLYAFKKRNFSEFARSSFRILTTQKGTTDKTRKR